MKTNKNLTRIFVLFVCVLALAMPATAQRKKTTTKKTTTKPATTVTTTNNLEIKETAQKVSTQLKNVTVFIYKLGGVASAIEQLDADAKANKLSKAQLDKFNLQKQAVIQSIVNLKAGLAELETQFRVKTSVKPYLLQIQGVTDLVTQSEDLARAGKFSESGKVLISVVEKLSDTLAAMP
jgi:hypothetical protein